MLHATYMAGVEYYPSDMMQRDQDFIAPGVITSDDLVVAPTSVPSMAVTVSGATQGSPGGNAWLPGGYRVYNDTQVMLPIAAADATNPRLDLVIATIDTTSTPYSASLQVIMGAPAASPTAPSIPVGLIALTLAQVEVPAGVTSIVAGNITDKRVISGLQGDGSRLRNIPSSAVPVATSTTAGIVKSSSSILVAGDGTLSATPNSIGADPAGAAASAQTAAEAYSDTALAAHQADYAYQKAGGTATAITLTIKETLTDGFPMTFIASAANSGASTTINGSPLYKPNTTTAPNLIAGKAYTVWWSQSGNCFFIKASAEGTAVATNVLAGTTFSNDNDTGISGTMPNNGALNYTPSVSAQTIPAGYTSGGTVQGAQLKQNFDSHLQNLPTEYAPACYDEYTGYLWAYKTSVPDGKAYGFNSTGTLVSTIICSQANTQIINVSKSHMLWAYNNYPSYITDKNGTLIHTFQSPLLAEPAIVNSGTNRLFSCYISSSNYYCYVYDLNGTLIGSPQITTSTYPVTGFMTSSNGVYAILINSAATLAYVFINNFGVVVNLNGISKLYMFWSLFPNALTQY
ncbi:hypothetical protein [Desulfosporosinus sp. FKA]|uniref:hypothetical protein n=1 Tax=Desulfosporosinus sp. FKA TaxID=1969834 RepID=UPI001FA8C5AB|nr:hypothetical protein [Desulfosporosinus sp. FKA]